MSLAPCKARRHIPRPPSRTPVSHYAAPGEAFATQAAFAASSSQSCPSSIQNSPAPSAAAPANSSTASLAIASCRDRYRITPAAPFLPPAPPIAGPFHTPPIRRKNILQCDMDPPAESAGSPANTASPFLECCSGTRVCRPNLAAATRKKAGPDRDAAPDHGSQPRSRPLHAP